MTPLALLPLLIRLTTAAISLATFQATDCSGNLDTNVHSNPANGAESSDCVATNQFNAVQVVSADQGFQCNIYSDRACQNFLDTFQTAGVCGAVIGSGVICFSQADFDNPLAGATAAMTVGTTLLTVTTAGSSLVSSGTQTSCSNSESSSYHNQTRRDNLSLVAHGIHDNELLTEISWALQPGVIRPTRSLKTTVIARKR